MSISIVLPDSTKRIASERPGASDNRDSMETPSESETNSIAACSSEIVSSKSAWSPDR